MEPRNTVIFEIVVTMNNGKKAVIFEEFAYEDESKTNYAINSRVGSTNNIFFTDSLGYRVGINYSQVVCVQARPRYDISSLPNSYIE